MRRFVALVLTFMAAANLTRANELNLFQAQGTIRQSVVGTIPSEIDESVHSVANVRSFCPLSDGLGDDTACVQAIVDSMCRKRDGVGAGTLFFPPGRYFIDAGKGINIPCPGFWIVGAGWGDQDAANPGSSINVTGRGSAPVFRFNGHVHPIRTYSFGGGVRDIGFHFANDQDNPTQMGPAIWFQTCWGCVVSNVFATHPYRFVVNYGGYMDRVTQSSVDYLAKSGEAILWIGSDAGCGGGPCQTRGDLFDVDHVMVNVFSDGRAKNKLNGTCIHLQDYVAGARLSNIACNQVGIGLKVDCPTSTLRGNCPGFINGNDVEIEGNGTEGPKRDDGASDSFVIVASDFEYMSVANSYLHGTAGVRNIVRALTTRFSQSGPLILNSTRVDGSAEACIVTDVPGFEMVGGSVYDCNQGSYNPTDPRAFGIELRNNPGGSALSGKDKIAEVTFCSYAGSKSGNAGGNGMSPILLGSEINFSVVTGNIFWGCNHGVVDLSVNGRNVDVNNTAN